MSLDLQSLITRPRDDSNPRIAKVVSTRKGTDYITGVHYNLIDRKDYETYRILKDDEVEREMTENVSHSQRLLYNWQGKSNDVNNHNKSPGKFRPPIMTSIANRKGLDLHNDVSSRNLYQESTQRSSYIAKPGKSIISQSLPRNTSNNSKSLNQHSIELQNNPELNLLEAVETMKAKYVQNIKVIDKLYQEKTSMAKKIVKLERVLNKVKHSDDSIHDILSDESDTSKKANANESIKANDLSGDKEEGGMDFKEFSIPNYDDLLSPNDVADIFNENSETVHPTLDDHFEEVIQRPRSASVQSNPTRRARTTSPISVRSQSNSNRRFTISPSLQADVDRYNQRMAIIRSKQIEKEKIEREEELVRREKLLRASSSNSVEIDRMLERQAKLKESSKMKKEYLQKKLQQDYDEEINELIRRRREQINKPIVKHDITWKEYEAFEEVKRKERIEQRKQQLLSITNVPTGLYDPNHLNNSRRSTPMKNEYYKPFRAKEDPEKIASKLLTKQKAWEEKLNQTKESIRTQLTQEDSLKYETTKSIVKSLEDRKNYYDMKRQERIKLQKQKEDEIKLKRIEEEKKKYDKIINSKFPDQRRRLTISAELRATKIREKLEKDIENEEKKQLLIEKKKKISKETGLLMEALIQQREYERKKKVGGFVELNNINEISAQKAAERRRDMREKLRKQRQDIEESKRRQPSLIERYEQDMAKKAGRDNGLLKVAEAAGVRDKKSKSGKYDDDDDNLDIFDEKEKLLLQL